MGIKISREHGNIVITRKNGNITHKYSFGHDNYENIFKNVHKNDCLICWDEIGNNKWAVCVRCNIFMHSECEQKYRKDRGYCKCPHCQHIGSIGSFRSI
jgi:hypothetical protein